MTQLYLVESPIPELDAVPGDVLADAPLCGIMLIRRLGADTELTPIIHARLTPIDPIAEE